jgi:hypothetical protein
MRAIFALNTWGGLTENKFQELRQWSTEDRRVLKYCRAYVDYIRLGIGLTTGFIGSHTVTVYTLYNPLQYTSLSSLGYNSRLLHGRNSEDCSSLYTLDWDTNM